MDDNYDGRGKPLDPGEIPLLPIHLKDDEYYRACGVVVVPDAGVYYCH